MHKDGKSLISRNGIAALAAVTCLLSGALAALATGEYQTAVDLYGKKRYAEAAPYFEAASLASPSNVAANYYAGYSFYLAGKRTESCRSFWRLLKTNPASKEAANATAMLKQLDPNYEKTVADQSNSAAAASLVSSVKPRAKPTAQAILSAIIQVKPPKGKLAAVSPIFVDKIKEMCASAPLAVLIFLKEKGASIVIAPSIVENDMRLQNTVPRGWSDDHNWKNSPALTHGTQVQVGQFRMDARTGEYIDTTPEVGVVRHELGHALDHCLNGFTDTDEFRHPYLLDLAKVPPEHAAKLEYVMQKAGSGPSECFAELFCYNIGGETDNRQEFCDLTHKYFPGAEKAMLKKMGEL